MKKHNLVAFGFGIALLATACKKTDMQQAPKEQAAPVAAVTAPASNWTILGNWSKKTEENYATYSNPVNDKAITAAIAEGGMVLAFMKNGNNITALPVEEKGNGSSSFWYYQVAAGTVVFNADAYGTTAAPGAERSFKYYVLTSDQLKDLEQKGYSKAELMRLTYENAQAILK